MDFRPDIVEDRAVDKALLANKTTIAIESVERLREFMAAGIS